MRYFFKEYWIGIYLDACGCVVINCVQLDCIILVITNNKHFFLQETNLNKYPNLTKSLTLGNRKYLSY